MAESKIINNYTSGNIWTQLIQFSFPFMLSNALQVLYSLVDMIIVGRFVGSAGLSAVSIASQVFMFMVMLCIGFSNGGQVLIAQYVGSNQKEKLNSIIGTLFSILFIIGIFMMVVGLLFSRSILQLLNTPAESYAMAADYILICSIGVLFSFGYNALSAVLRGMGDSKHPFIFILIASVTNIFLDLLFIGVFKWQAAGAALATIIGQTVSFIFAVIYLYKRKESFGFDFKLRSFRIDAEARRLLVKLGLPFAVQSCAINISMLFVNALVNSLGVYPSATFGVGMKIDDIINKITLGIGFATSTMCAQNIGAKEFGRTKKIVYVTILYQAVCYAFFTLIYLTLARELFSIFTNDVHVLDLSRTYVTAIVWSFPGMILMRASNGIIRGVGNARLGLIFGLMDAFIFRIGCSWFLGSVCGLGLYGYFLGYSIAVYGTGIPGFIYFLSNKWEKYRLM
ncbi:MATE family efflux transporter [Sediminispirochaeta smaragdinae]|uniref:MATE efflux family protein n=1 Tax=Sediminispirochaeta smaragdinae (strain DSM 11293 / JCM 15392 / SEBR 4228) TaxID=573413 RepID=E1RB37_SEDSS|nr:MATE family efflux transporter [Sediminispirochaeta smaragdinae]ADK79567.1 MATE efflux family protein [Sediminispirochaeta smaragdinae DSM 11293]